MLEDIQQETLLFGDLKNNGIPKKIIDLSMQKLCVTHVHPRSKRSQVEALHKALMDKLDQFSSSPGAPCFCMDMPRG